MVGTMTVKIGFCQDCILGPFPVLASFRKLSQPQPNLWQQKRARMSEPSGRMLVETIKSQKSKKVVPSENGWKWMTLNPSAVVSASKNTRIPQTRLPFGRDQPVSSRIMARIFSHTPSTVESAAKTIKRKNKAPQIRPPDMLLNTVAIVSNNRLGPAFTSRF